MNIISAQYANPDHTSAILQTEAAGAIVCSQVDTPELWLQLHESELVILDFVPEPVAPKTSSALAFVELFTEEEQIAIVTATMANPVVKLWYDKLMAADIVVYNDARLIAGMDALVQFGLLTNERENEILGIEPEIVEPEPEE